MEAITRSNVNLEDMLGEALDEIHYLKVKHHLGHKALKLLQRKACLSSEDGESGFVRLKTQTAQAEKRVEGQLLAQEVQLSAEWLDVQQWKRRSALLQLKLDSAHEDLDHLKMEKSLLTSEFDTQAQLCRTIEAQRAEAQVSIGRLQAAIEGAAKQLQDAESRLRQAEKAAGATKQALVEQLHIATTKIGALDEHAKLAEQKAASAQERATLLEDRLVNREVELGKDLAMAKGRAAKLEARLAESEADLAKRLSVAEERARMTNGLSQERVQAAAERAAFLEENLRQQVKEVQRTLENERKERHNMEQASSKRVEALSKQLQAAEVAVSQLESQLRAKGRQIAALEEAGPRSSETPSEMANVALGMVSSMVEQLGSPVSSQPQPPFQAAPRPAATLAVGGPPKAGEGAAAGEQVQVARVPAPEVSCKRGAAGSDAPQEASKADDAPMGDVENLPAKPAGNAKAGQKAKASPTGKHVGKAQAGLKPKAAAKKPAAKKKGAAGVEAADASETQEAGPSPQAGIEGRRQPVRQRTNARPYWLGTTGHEAPPAELSPSPSSPGSEEADDPYSMPPLRRASPVACAAAAEAPKGTSDLADNPAAAEALKQGRQGGKGGLAGRKRQQIKGKAASPAGQSEVVEDTAMLVIPSAEEAEAAGVADPVPEAQIDDGEVVPEKEAREKAAGKLQAGASKRRTRASMQAEDVQPQRAAAKKQKLSGTAEEQLATESEAHPAASQQPTQGQGAQPPAKQAEQPGAAANKKTGKAATRPLGVSKIDLTAVWGDSATPAGTPAEASGAGPGRHQKQAAAAAPACEPALVSEGGVQQDGKENSMRNQGNGAAAASARPLKPGSKLQSDPLAGLNPKVLEAAAAHSQRSNGSMAAQLGTRRSSQMPANQNNTSKRKLLNPTNQDLLPRDLLLGTGAGVMIPKLRKP